MRSREATHESCRALLLRWLSRKIDVLVMGMLGRPQSVCEHLSVPDVSCSLQMATAVLCSISSRRYDAFGTAIFGRSERFGLSSPAMLANYGQANHFISACLRACFLDSLRTRQ